KGLELIADIAPDLPEGVAGDPGRLAQVISNLVGNAIKFTNVGQVLVHVRCDEQGDGRARLNFAVADTGIGIPKAKQSAIFEAFSQADGSTTRRFGGTGLGLTISSTIVRMMDGAIWVDSEPGAGSTFHFTVSLPLADLPHKAFLRLPPETPVLIVDDNAINRR